MSTPYMAMDLPTPGADDGTWDTKLNTALEDKIDIHDHTAGKGVKVPSAGLNINADVEMNSNSLTEVETIAFDSQGASLASSNTRKLYVVNGDLWYNNNSGTAVQLTSGASISTPSSDNSPSGMIVAYGGVAAPSGFLMCDGTAVSRAGYSDLFTAIGTTFGVGDGATTFNLPNLKGRAPIGAGNYTDSVSGSTTRVLGTNYGAEAHVVTTDQMPSHNHTQDAHTHTATDAGHTHGVNYTGNVTGAEARLDYNTTGEVGNNGTQASNSGTASITVGGTVATNQATGGGTSHNNMQPSLGVNYIIKT